MSSRRPPTSAVPGAAPGPSRPLLTRRLFLADLGGAAAAVFLAACTGSTDTSSTGGSPSSAGGTAGGTDAPTSGTGAATASASPVDPEVLRWERVLGGAAAAYVLVRAGEATIVDTGHDGTAADLGIALAALGSRWEDVSTVVLTHHHPDHVGGLGGVAELATGATLAAGAGDIEAITGPRDILAIGNGDRIMGMEVIETPGHTPGHVSVHDPTTGVLVAGDALNSTDVGAVAGPNPSFTDDLDLAWASAATLAALEPSVILVGHGPPVQDDAATGLQELVAAEGA